MIAPNSMDVGVLKARVILLMVMQAAIFPIFGQVVSSAFSSRIEMSRLFVSHDFGLQVNRNELTAEISFGYLPDRLWRYHHFSPNFGGKIYYTTLKKEKLEIQTGIKFRLNRRAFYSNPAIKVEDYEASFTGYYGKRFQCFLGFDFGFSNLRYGQKNNFFLNYGLALGIRYQFKKYGSHD